MYGFRGEEQFVPCRHGFGEYVNAVYWHLHVLHPNGSIAQETLMGKCVLHPNGYIVQETLMGKCVLHSNVSIVQETLMGKCFLHSNGSIVQ